MTREDVANMIGWSRIIWVIGFLNMGAMLPHLKKIAFMRETDGLSLQTLGVVLLIQVGFALHGFFTRDATLMLSNAFAASINLACVLLTISIRRSKCRNS